MVTTVAMPFEDSTVAVVKATTLEVISKPMVAAIGFNCCSSHFCRLDLRSFSGFLHLGSFGHIVAAGAMGEMSKIVQL